MPKEKKTPSPPPKYRVLDSALLDRGRRGKHYDLIQGVIRELKAVETGSALEIPLDDIGGIGLTNLRSAVHRGATAAGLEIETLADAKHFYVWKIHPLKAAGGR
jgi:hypothetical protein